ncbi:MAG TPA: single-stranded DNA-binding protein [Acidobacteriaceae bacterium]|nr:single-stranded DNA-binding protein [Acidobacteriaceae bacterium]
MNTGTLAGNIGRDASTKTVGDTTVTNFSLAVNTGFGEKKSTLWVGCALWGARGQKLEQYLTSGTKVAVSGDIDVRAYAAKDGTPKAELTCNVQRITLQGGGERRDQDPPQTLAEKSRGTAPAVDEDFNDPCPF